MPDSGDFFPTTIKVSELPVAAEANATDQLEANQAGTTRSVTLDQVSTLVAASDQIGDIIAGAIDATSASTLVDLKALPTSVGCVMTQCRVTAGDQGGGAWVFVSGDQSARVSSDTQSGLWAAPNSDPTCASGAWQRQFTGPAHVQWFGLTIDASVDQVPIINAAIRACELLRVGTLHLPVGRIRCDSSILLGKYGVLALAGSGPIRTIATTLLNNPLDSVTLLDFDTAPAATVAVEIGAEFQGDDEGRFGTGVHNLCIVRETPLAAGAGGVGMRLSGIRNGRFQDILISGFDIGTHLRTNAFGDLATFMNVFENVSTKYNGNYGWLLESAVECSFEQCDMLGATIAGMYITQPAVVIGNTRSNGNYYSDCVFIGNQGTVPQYNLLIGSGYGHWFVNCSLEEATVSNLKIKVGGAGGHGFTAPTVQMANCWFNQGNTGTCCDFDECNFEIVNSRFTCVSATKAAIRIGMDTALGTGSYGSTIAGSLIAYTFAGIEVQTFDFLKVNGCSMADRLSSNKPAFVLSGNALRNIFTGNTLRTTHAVGWTNSTPAGNGNVFTDNMLQGTSTVIESCYNRTIGGQTLFADNLGIGPASFPTARLHVQGAGQTTSNPSTSATLGATVYVQDSGALVGNGGMLQFGASQGAFASVKGSIIDGADNTTGDLVIATRRVSTDAALTESLRVRVNGDCWIRGNLTTLQGVAVGAANVLQAFIKGATGNLGIYYGTGAPGFSAAKGSLYTRTDGAANTRLYIATDSAGTWTAIASS
jgi:hypothetical protein